jgi:CheY-like chemotaxis protein
MDPLPTNALSDAQSARSPAVASELNNLLQIIAGTTAHLENIWEGSPRADEYFAMLRSSVARAAQVTAQLVEHPEGFDKKVIMHPAFANFRKVAPTVRPAAEKQRIMLVDDEKMLLILSGETLKEAGYEVVTAHSGFECLDFFRWNPLQIDLVLLDLTMPLMDGEETFRRLRALRPNLPVVLCTGHVHQERLNHMLAEGLSGFMRKPLAGREYVASVRAILEGAIRSVAPSFNSIAAAT